MVCDTTTVLHPALHASGPLTKTTRRARQLKHVIVMLCMNTIIFYREHTHLKTTTYTPSYSLTP